VVIARECRKPNAAGQWTCTAASVTSRPTLTPVDDEHPQRNEQHPPHDAAGIGQHEAREQAEHRQPVAPIHDAQARRARQPKGPSRREGLEPAQR
jgi:hypothetical protein